MGRSFKGWDWIINSTADWGRAMQLINQPHWDHSIEVITSVLDQLAGNEAVWGFSPVNEVGAWTPMDVLRKFYWEAYNMVRDKAPKWVFVMDASFRGPEIGRDNFMRGCPNKAIDKHPYHAWASWGPVETYYARSCGWANEQSELEAEIDFPAIAGEWSLAMDTCAMWLLGFNDMQPGEPRAICDMVPCPCADKSDNDEFDRPTKSTMSACYLGQDHPLLPGLPLDATEGLQGPFGSGISGPMFGMCPREMAHGRREDEYMTTLAHKQIEAFNAGHGWFFWNFRTELEPHWDFLEAWRRGWFPRNVSDLEAIKKLKVCDADTLPLRPTVHRPPPPPPAGATPPAVPYLIGGLAGGLIGALAAFAAGRYRCSPPAVESTPYVAMAPAS